VNGYKIYVPLDIRKVAEGLKTEEDIVFGRLYYQLEHKYGYVKSDKTHVHFFKLSIQLMDGRREIHLINFPYMAAILADLRHEHKVQRLNLWTAIGSAAFAFISAIAASIALRGPSQEPPKVPPTPPSISEQPTPATSHDRAARKGK